MTSVLITGAAGFLGRAVLARLLRTSEARVTSVGEAPLDPERYPHRICWGSRELRAPVPEPLRAAPGDWRVSHHELSLHDRPAVSRLLTSVRPTVVLHLASLSDPDPAPGISSLIEAIVGAGVRPERVVVATDLTMRPARTRTQLVEARLRLAAQRHGEEVARVLAGHHGLPLLVARCAELLGPGAPVDSGAAGLTLQAARVALAGAPPVLYTANLERRRDRLHVDDAASALLRLATDGAPGTTCGVGTGVASSEQAVLEHVLDAVDLQGEVELRPVEDGGGADAADVSALAALGWAPSHGLRETLDGMARWLARDVADAAAARVRPDTSVERFEVRAQRDDRYIVEILPGLLGSLPERLRSLAPGRRVFVLTDTRVEALYARTVVDGLKNRGVQADLFALPEGETSKAFDPFREVIVAMHECGFGRRDLLVNLGGGLVCDVGGYVAASYLRGVAYVNVPTTLLAQHDAAVGGKVAVNMPWAKNFVGAFHHPSAVFIDPEVLQTLDDRGVAAGVAEAVKVALCGSAELFEVLEDSGRAIREDRDPHALAKVVALAASTKARLLEPDPYEIDLRRPLNLGHTFAHPLETELAYEGLLHGEAVGFGLAVCVMLGLQRGVCEPELAERILALLDAYGLPPRVARPRLVQALEHLSGVRLVRAGALNVVLPTRLGEVEIVGDIPQRDFVEALAALSRHPVVGGCVGAA